MADRPQPSDALLEAEIERLFGEARTDAPADELSRLVMENSLDHIMLLDPDGTIRYINRTVPDLTVEQVLGTRIYDYLDEDQAAKAGAALERVLETGEPDCYE